MFEAGAIVDGRFQVQGVCSTAGGMGNILYVRDVTSPAVQLVLKYCKIDEESVSARFRREARVMQDFAGNPRVAPIAYANLEHTPPFFVMPFFEHGDLSRQAPSLRQDLRHIEICFNLMIDCIEQLHAKGIYHRDIKPQNFLVGNGTIVVSDLGLCTEYGSATAFTHTSVAGGTPAFMPPEFWSGGFKHADAAGDIYMLGVSFLSILAGVETAREASGLIDPPLLVVIERACAPDRERRYGSLAELRQSLKFAFDSVLNRVSGSIGVLGAQQAIVDRWKTTGHAEVTEISLFLDELVVLPPADQQRVCMDLPSEFFQALASTVLSPGRLAGMLRSYLGMAASADYGWSFAEVIADNMKVIFGSSFSAPADKAEALRTAIVAAVRQNRFAAMDSCKVMIASVAEPGLAQRIVEVMLQHQAPFMQDIDPLACKSGAIRQAIAVFKAGAGSMESMVPTTPFPI